MTDYSWLDVVNPLSVREAQAAVAIPANADKTAKYTTFAASAMEDLGVDPLKIYNQTGFVRGINGQWQSVIDTSEGTDKLFQAQPSLRNVPVTVSGRPIPGVPSSYQRNMRTGSDQILIVPDRRPDNKEQIDHEFGHAAVFHHNPAQGAAELSGNPYYGPQDIQNFIMQSVRNPKDPKEAKAMINVMGRKPTEALAAYDEIKAELQLQKIDPKKYETLGRDALERLRNAAKYFPADFATSDVKTGAKRIKNLVR